MALAYKWGWHLGIVALLVVLAFLFWGAAGVRTIAGFALLVVLPFYLVFDMFKLQEQEKIAFAFCAGISLFPSFAYWLGFAVPFSVAIWTTSGILFALAIGARLLFRKKTSP